MSSEEIIENLRRIRGTVRRSLTKFGDTVGDLEVNSDKEDAAAHAKLLIDSLDQLDSDFKSFHFKVIDLIRDDDEKTMDKEHEHLDRHNDSVTRRRLRLQSLVAATTTAATSTARKTLARMSHVERNLHATADGLGVSGIEHDLSLVELHHEQLINIKKTLASIHDDLLALDLEDDDDLFIQHTKLERLQFDGSHKTKKLLGPSIKETPAAYGKGSMKLPKLDVPTFDGDQLNWSQFWEQFSVSMHERKNLSNT